MSKSLTEKQQLFLDYLFDEECQGQARAAMTKAGYSKETPINQVTNSLKDEIVAKTKDFLSSSAATKAAYTMYSALDHDGTNLGMKERIVAAKDILSRANIQEVTEVKITADAPLFILPPKDKDDD